MMIDYFYYYMKGCAACVHVRERISMLLCVPALSVQAATGRPDGASRVKSGTRVRVRARHELTMSELGIN